MAKAWVIRRTKDGLFYQDETLPGDKWASSLVTAHRWYDGRACSEACDPGEELVQLDDAGQLVEAKTEPAPAVAQPSPYSESADEPVPYRLATPTPDEPIPVTTAELITAECEAIAKMLLAKNAAYGDSALSPVRVFSRADSVEQIKVRIDDKLSRLARGSGTETEDVVSDLLGYLVLLRIAQRKAAT